MHPKKLKDLSLSLGFRFFEYFSFELKFEYFANFLKEKKNKVLSMDLSINCDFFSYF